MVGRKTLEPQVARSSARFVAQNEMLAAARPLEELLARKTLGH